MKKCLSLFLFLISTFSLAQTQLTQIPTEKGGVPPKDLFFFKDRIYFLSTNRESGEELWVSDGTSAGTRILKDILPGIENSEISNLVVFQEKFYFTVSDGTVGTQIWYSDGSTEGTKPLTVDLQLTITGMMAFGEDLYFFSNPDGSTLKLWKLDLETSAINLVKDCDAISRPENLTSALGLIFFSAMSPDGLFQVFRSDGTADGTYSIGANFSFDSSKGENLAQFIEFNGSLYFIAESTDFSPGMPVGIVKTDGTAEGTELLKAVFDQSIRNLTFTDAVICNGKLYFSFYFPYLEFRYFIIETDGLAENTRVIHDQTTSSFFVPSTLGISNDQLIFTRGNGSTTDLISFDPITLSSSDIASVGTNIGMSYLYKQNTVEIIEGFSGKYFVKVSNEVLNASIWATDGTPAGTYQLASAAGGDRTQLVIMNNVLFFSGFLDNSWGLLASNGTTTEMLKENTWNSSGFDPRSDLVQINDVAVFNAYSKVTQGNELWVTDGTPEGTKVVKEKSFLSPGNFVTHGEKEFFIGRHESVSWEVFATDGTSAGTTKLTDLLSKQVQAVWLSPLSDSHFILGGIRQLQVSSVIYTMDGNGAITELKDFGKSAKNQIWSIAEYKHAGDFVYLLLQAGGDGELWRTDGTVNGTVRIAQFARGRELTIVRNQVFFVAWEDLSSNPVLYRYDGSQAAGPVADLVNSFGISVYPVFRLAALNDKLIFINFSPDTGRELWISDGTSANTKLLKDINLGQASGLTYLPFVKYKDKLFFRAYNAAHGFELWSTDGTGIGTAIVKDIAPGVDSSMPMQMTAFDDALYFTAMDSEHGQELWRTTGSANSTSLVLDLVPGTGSSVPRRFVKLDNDLIFVAEAAPLNSQLYSFEVAVTTAVESDNEWAFSAFPNPTSGILNITINGTNTDWVALYSSSGALVDMISSPGKECSLDFKNFPAGLYFVRVESKASSRTIKVIRK
jgi:ELWxxDGT repeat protein